MVQFVRFSYYKTANRTAPCGVVRCGAILLALRCSYAILRAVLVLFLRFVRFMQFDEHLYIYIYIYIYIYRAFSSKNANILPFNISKSYFINFNIPLYNKSDIKHPIFFFTTSFK